MIIADQVLEGRDAILAAADHHPYARHALWRGERPRGWRRDGALVWLLAGQGPAGGGLGVAEAAVGVAAGLAAAGATSASSPA